MSTVPVVRFPAPRFRAAAVLAALFALCPTAVRAQLEGDPQERIKEIARKVAEEMKEIDRMLLEAASRSRQGATSGEAAGTTGEAAGGMERSVERMRQLLQQSSTSQGQTVQNISELIREIESMKGSGSSQGDDPNGQGGQGRQDMNRQDPGQGQQGQQGTRDQTMTPEMVRQQQGQQEGQEPGKPEGGDPTGNQENPAGGQNTRTGQQPDGATDRVERNDEAAQWGNLPKYLQFLQGRGGAPEVPDRYRKYVEAFVKQGQKSGQKK